MANVRTILTFLDYTPTATEANASFPVTNLELYGHPFRPWKATQHSVIVNVTLDFGVGEVLDVAVVGCLGLAEPFGVDHQQSGRQSVLSGSHESSGSMETVKA